MKTRPQSATGRANGDTVHELSNYRLHERIGQEELATVYRAAHAVLDRPVQLHILRRTDWVSSSRFQLAARLAARLSHPNLLPVIDAGHDNRYGHYLVTPLVEGQTLAELLKAGPLDAPTALRIAAQVAAALDYLHSQQVIHRDVQPANILVTPQHVAYLANLSLAASPETPDLSSVDEADYLTPYSAPEQRLDNAESSPALDVYGLGAVVYHMLGGEVSPSPAAPPPPLAGRDPALRGADLIIQRMMAQQPAARYPGAGAAVVALRQALRLQLEGATPDLEESRWETVAEWLENPLEAALGDTLEQAFKDFVDASRKRANELHRRDAVRRLLNRWSRAGFFRRHNLGQLVEPEQIVSYNIYFYELRTYYETRRAPETRQRPQGPDERTAVLPSPGVWEVQVPADLDADRPQELVLPNSTRVLTCPDCGGVSTVVCKSCGGKGTVERVRKVRNPDNSTAEETITGDCSACRGYGRQKCTRCAGSGNLVEEQVFTLVRRARLWENADDLEGLPVRALQPRLQEVYNAPIEPYEGRWHSIAPLSELLRAAIADVGDDTRITRAELTMRGVPITEIDSRLDEKPLRLYIVGHDNAIIAGWGMINAERVVLVVVLAVIVIAVLVFGLTLRGWA